MSVSRAKRRPYRLGLREVTQQETRRRIVEATLRLFAESGYHDVSVDEVAEAAGVSRPTIYKHFKSKPTLLKALQEELVRHGGLDRVHEARLHPDPIEALRRFILENCRMFATILPAMRIGRAAAWTDDDVRRITDATYHAGRRASITGLVARLSDDIGLRASWPPSRVIDALMALTDFEPFDTLTSVQGRSTEEAAEILFDLARVPVAPLRFRRAKPGRPPT